ncbi:MAG TPA: tripartite tricarboxylate transporter TctB family protein [Afifellaceae bacterium]|nr:tripartite tricarboxylate transporter TctB family protein [Afifellaceae bacterium]
MHAATPSEAPKLVRSALAPLVLIALSVGLLVWSSTYNETARQVPMLVAGAMLVLSVIDLVCRFDAPGLRPLRDFWGADFRNREMRHNPPWRAEVIQALWMIACVAAMLAIGFLLAVPLFVFAYMVVNGKRPVGESLITALVVFGFVYIVFEVLLDYHLYRGALFDARGVADW